MSRIEGIAKKMPKRSFSSNQAFCRGRW